MNIIVLRLKYPNDPTDTLVPHQHFVYDFSDKCIELYSVSSILGKENRVFGENADDYERIEGQEYIDNGFKTPSFIDCTKRYRVMLDASVDLRLANSREIDNNIVERIKKRIDKKIAEGNHTEFTVSANDLKLWNRKISKG